MPAVRPIAEVADALGVARKHLIPFGDDKAKVQLEALKREAPRGKLILVSAITPTSAGEGKTTTSIGLAQGLAKIGQKACLALREPSLGPTFGVKGGATGGGRSILVPAVDINLHFTGDFHAITSANNLLASLVDNHIHAGNARGIDPRKVLWRRVIDLNDRSLRRVIIGLGGALEGVPRETGFDITPASEIMAVLCLSEDREDLRARLSRLMVAIDGEGAPVTAHELKATGALMILLKDAIQPNLVQTCEGVPAFVHGGPFANIAHGCNSVIATKMALAHADWAITEAGFGLDLGAEKFINIKCASAGLETAAIVLVATIRALKRHGGSNKDELVTPDAGAVERGLPNLEKHIENARLFGHNPIVVLNRFATDGDDELLVVRRACARFGVPCANADIFARGGEGGRELAEAVVQHAVAPSPMKRLYDWSEPLKQKIDKICRQIYGASDVAYAPAAERDLKQAERLGFAGAPICMAKTQMSLSDDAKRVGRPEGFTVTVRNVVIAAGAGFVVPLLGDIIRMPGLNATPQAERMDLVDGKVVGLLGG